MTHKLMQAFKTFRLPDHTHTDGATVIMTLLLYESWKDTKELQQADNDRKTSVSNQKAAALQSSVTDDDTAKKGLRLSKHVGCCCSINSHSLIPPSVAMLQCVWIRTPQEKRWQVTQRVANSEA